MYCPNRVWGTVGADVLLLGLLSGIVFGRLVGSVRFTSVRFSWLHVCPHVTKACGVVCTPLSLYPSPTLSKNQLQPDKIDKKRSKVQLDNEIPYTW